MSKHTLFLVHGMGRHVGTQWSDEIWNKLIECSERYPHFRTRKALDEYAEPVPVGYDEHIRAALARWDAEATQFSTFAQASELRNGDSLDWLTGISNDDAGFIFSHAADVIIWRFFRLEAGRIRANVRLKIFQEIEQKLAQDSSAEFSLMAHSLGTSVSHDVLAEYGTAHMVGADINALGTRNFHFRSIHMLANVSRLLQTDYKAYESVVRPGRRGTLTSYCDRMYSYRHELDPITKPRPFDPVSWSSDFRLINIDHYRGWNVHGWLHYLDNPRVHIPLLKSITKPSAITPQQERNAVGDYPRFGGDLENLATTQGKIAEIHALLESIDVDGNLGKNFATLLLIWAAIQELKHIGGETWSKLEEEGLS